MEKGETKKIGMQKIVVLDDDPTGIQTVQGVSVYTDWSLDSIRLGFSGKEEMFFILTNSRSFSREETIRVHQDIAARLAQVSKESGKEFLVVCRGDSTLRGHYLLEPETIAQGLEENMGYSVDGEIYCPCFFECGRVTVDDIHYLEEGGRKIPVSETEFADDRTFGYRNSHLGRYIEEKTDGRCKAGECLSLPAMGEGGTFDMEKTGLLLHRAVNRRKIIVNASSYEELDQFCRILRAELELGKHFIVRCAASFVKSAGCFEPQPLLSGNRLKMKGNRNGGLIIAGSYVEKTTEQLKNLEESGLPFHFIEFKQESQCIGRVVEEKLRLGENVVIYTSRKPLDCKTLTPEQTLMHSVAISEALVGIVGEIQSPPSFFIAKGGITSSDMGTKALRVKQARVLGQALSGVPVWMTGEESRFPGLPFIIFPGNVGNRESLRLLAEKIITEAGTEPVAK